MHRRSQRAVLRLLSEKIERHGGGKQRNWEVDQRHVLGVLGQDHRLRSNGFTPIVPYFTTTLPVIFG
jgi:hypothetical protein